VEKILSSTKEALSFPTDYESPRHQVRGDLAALSLRFSFLRELKSTDKTRYFLAHDHTKDINQVVMARVLSADVVDEPSELLAFLVEAQAAASLSHKNIAVSTKPEQAGGIHFYVSQYPEGASSLRDLLDQKGWLEVAPFLKIASQIAHALHYAQQMEVLHLKLQPEYLLIDRDLKVTLTGFGIPGRPARQWLYQKRSQECPLAYRSPEQLANQDLDERSDLYTLGILLYEMLTDLLPFNAQDETQLRRKITIHKAPVVHLIRPDIPESLSAIVAKLIAADPAERFQNAAELRSALAHLADHLSRQVIVEGETVAAEIERGEEDGSDPLAYEPEESNESLPYRFEEESEPLSLDFNGAEDVKNLADWPSERFNDDYDLLTASNSQRLSESLAPADPQNQIDKIPSQPLAEEVREISQVRAATKSKPRKSLLFALLAIGIAIITEIFVLAYTGHLKRFFKGATASGHTTLPTQSSVTDINPQPDVNRQGDSEDRSAAADKQPVAAEGASEAPDANPPASDGQPQDTGEAPDSRQTAAGATLPAPARIKPDTSRLREQLRKTNKAKAANHKIKKSNAKARPGKAKPRRGFFRWRPW
jgi:serine/threonine protein kinase